jgi:hypothetical protein
MISRNVYGETPYTGRVIGRPIGATDERGKAMKTEGTRDTKATAIDFLRALTLGYRGETDESGDELWNAPDGCGPILLAMLDKAEQASWATNDPKTRKLLDALRNAFDFLEEGND